jgi:uncharacterized protein YndB with AHSA1/START domain
MAAEELTFTFEREFDVSPGVVWDALIDQDLVVGWLAEATIEPQRGGRYDLVWLSSASYPPTRGTIVTIDEPEHLVISTDNRGTIDYRLEDLADIDRVRGTRVTITVCVDVEAAFSPRVSADWMITLDQLGDLLRGHPVDWAHWDRDHVAAWRGYLQTSEKRKI